ncbi:MAG: CpsD/CapB family tyrosine-protein kinase [Gemmataceae bacterium]|nr:CpsD/CapB family tyrosine-protein kinase [Gemmataceae bacterium]
MTDLWKPNGVVEPRVPALEVIPAPDPDHDWFAGADVVPFVEVGAGASVEPEIRLATPPAEPVTVPVIAPAITAEVPLPPGLFTVRFRPVVAGHLPGRGFGPELIALHEPEHPISEQYRLLLGELALQTAQGSPRVMLFTGATASSGTSTVVMNLALTIARTESARVLVVDANPSRPAIAERLGLASSPGLGEVLAGRTPLSWAIQSTKLKSLRALTAGRINLASEAAFPPLIERLRNEADWILIDAPAWSRPADAVPLADCCDALYLVVRQPDADTTTALELQQGFLDSTGRLRGCILTER